MRVILAKLADFGWLLYVACAFGAVVYIARALSLQRRQSGSVTLFEREATTFQVVRLWRTASIFVLVGVILFVGQIYLLPRVVPDDLLPPTPTLVAGLASPTPSPSPTVAPQSGSLPTVVATTAAVPPPPSPEATVTPSPTPTPTEAAGPAYQVYARLGNVAELVGYDLPSTDVHTGQPLPLTLYWRALDGAGAADYVVFAHILAADGHLVGQHDGPPAGGTHPTPGWIPGEVMADSHEMTFREPYSGPARIEVGLYDPVTMERVPVAGGAGYVLLPIEVTVNNDQ